jgi:hypothetical protein
MRYILSFLLSRIGSTGSWFDVQRQPVGWTRYSGPHPSMSGNGHRWLKWPRRLLSFSWARFDQKILTGHVAHRQDGSDWQSGHHGAQTAVEWEVSRGNPLDTYDHTLSLVTRLYTGVTEKAFSVTYITIHLLQGFVNHSIISDVGGFRFITRSKETPGK